MDFGIIFSFIAVIISIVSVVITYQSVKEQRRASKNSAAYTYLISAESMLERHPELFELHNIDQRMMDECGISPIELLYLMESFTSADLYHRIEGDKTVQLSEYRKILLSNPKVRTAWSKIIKHRLISDSPFSNEVDKFIAQQEHSQLNGGQTSRGHIE
jgi:hypothetical protein